MPWGHCILKKSGGVGGGGGGGGGECVFIIQSVVNQRLPNTCNKQY